MATPPAATRRSKPKPPPATLLLFVRHGLTPTTGKILPGRAPGLHLADQGRAQAEAVAERLATWLLPSSDGHRGRRRQPKVAAVYASPLERTQETAGFIAKRLGLEVLIEDGLLECDFGEWTGAELKALAKLPQWTTVQRYPSGFRFPGGESFEGLRARMAETIAEFCRRHAGEVVVAVSHADPIKAAVSDAIGAHLDLFQRIMVSPCSVTAIRYYATGPTVLAVNWMGSLPELFGLPGLSPS
jgi:probable phosphoglycerate mutase